MHNTLYFSIHLWFNSHKHHPKGGLTIYTTLLNERQKLEEKLISIRTQLNTLPAGELSCNKNGRYFKWFRKTGTTRTYLTKRQRPLAEKLALKKYLTCCYSDILHEKDSINLYLKAHNSYNSKADELLESTEFQKLLAPNFQTFSPDITAWLNEPYHRNPKYPNQLKHSTISGYFVRSKSEALIDTLLLTHKIPFRYECELNLGDITVYPDFTIMHPKTKQIYYWEHFGQMDKFSYYNNVSTKLLTYNSHDIVQTINLITTYETKDHPLTANKIERIINEYFLS